MKRILFAILAVVMTTAVATAQNYMVVDSEKVFKSIAAYNEALEQIETLSQTYQKQVDTKFAAVETLYNNYMAQRASLSESARQSREQQILNAEAEATEYQESIFGTDGTLIKKRIELIQPIQKKVFDTIKQYAEKKGYDMIIDISQNATMLYYSERADHTDEIIAILK